MPLGKFAPVDDYRWRSYRKKPVTVQAVRMNAPFEVETLEGKMQGNTGDWLIEGVEGEMYPCKDSVFRKTYEMAEELGGGIMSVKFYCEVCEGFQPVEIEPIQQDDLNPMPWGDVICANCHFVIATMTADEPGVYAMVKIRELRNRRAINKLKGN